MWKVGGIKIELAIGCQRYFCGRTQRLVKKTDFFYFSGRYLETNRDLSWVMMGQGEKAGIHRRTNVFWTEIESGAVLTVFWSPDVR